MTENPYESAKEESDARNSSSLLRRFGGLVIVVVISGVLVALLLLPTIRMGRGPARRAQCRSQLQQIALALMNYEDEYGSWPPAYTVDDQGNRLHSWRTLILPYLEEQQLYESIDLSKPWDDPVNVAARRSSPFLYRCPSASIEDELGTTYLAIVGKQTVFPEDTSHTWNRVADLRTESIAVVDAPVSRAVHWMEPKDIRPEELLDVVANETMQHTAGMLVAFADGDVETLKPDTPRSELRAMLTVDE